jgi:predicted metalloprotease
MEGMMAGHARMDDRIQRAAAKGGFCHIRRGRIRRQAHLRAARGCRKVPVAHADGERSIAMLWKKGRSSDNVEEATGGGGGGGFGRIHLGLGGTLVAIVVAMIFPSTRGIIFGLLTGNDAGTTASGTPAQTTRADISDPQVQFVSKVLGSTEDVWSAYFRQAGEHYVEPKLTLFHGQVSTACGGASAAVGPFYCPGDQRIYLDLDFFRELATRFHSDGDFARAYVIAHEVGHHVQDQLGVMRMEQQLARQGEPMKGADGLSVRLELQADCLAGVWANKSQRQLQWLQPGDIESALGAAAQIGDDTLQREARGTVMPDSFTHGTSAERVRWFKTGFQAGDIGACDTFHAQTL